LLYGLLRHRGAENGGARSAGDGDFSLGNDFPKKAMSGMNRRPCRRREIPALATSRNLNLQ